MYELASNHSPSPKLFETGRFCIVWHHKKLSLKIVACKASPLLEEEINWLKQFLPDFEGLQKRSYGCRRLHFNDREKRDIDERMDQAG